jgi:hypothetical protein
MSGSRRVVDLCKTPENPHQRNSKFYRFIGAGKLFFGFFYRIIGAGKHFSVFFYRFIGEGKLFFGFFIASSVQVNFFSVFSIASLVQENFLSVLSIASLVKKILPNKIVSLYSILSQKLCFGIALIDTFLSIAAHLWMSLTKLSLGGHTHFITGQGEFG